MQTMQMMQRTRPFLWTLWISTLLACCALAAPLRAAGDESITPAPPRAEGDGPYDRLILRGVTVIDGTGAPPVGPVDVIIQKNRIADIVPVGSPGLPIDPAGRPKAGPADKEMDLQGMYVLPGFIDMHGHIGGKDQGTPAEYVFKLWMGHGITTVRDPGSGNGLPWVLDEKAKSARDEITAPRIQAYVFFGQGWDKPVTTPEQARKWVDEVAAQGANGVKFFGNPPEIMKAALEETKKKGLRSACHHSQTYVARDNALTSARWGLTSMEHWYGLPEALFTDRTIQDYPTSYNYGDESHRFGEAGRLWRQAAPRGSERWNQVIDEMIKLDFTIDPTLTIYEASRDLMRARRAEWHEEYTLPSLWDFYSPSRKSHGSYWYHWSTQDEIDWKQNYRIWMSFLEDFKNRGGRVTTGSDSGYIYKLYGFDYIREFELLQEAGFHPLEVIRSATLYGAQALGLDKEIGSVEPGKLADLVVVAENPLDDFKVLYGTGTIRVTPDNKVVRTTGIRYTIKDGIVYDSKKLLADVRKMVRDAKEKAGRPVLLQPGVSSPGL
ncbi:MAG TPA: amidohydrolase family protein [Thermoanaerobaculia bacterium]|nr:amidohydrolase family protein [Thermoanaerobaculia bacterium]